jgi:hypothetical protein
MDSTRRLADTLIKFVYKGKIQTGHYSVDMSIETESVRSNFKQVNLKNDRVIPRIQWK